MHPPIPVISAQKILYLGPDDVLLKWETSIPSSGLKECEERIAKEAAAAAGFDMVAIKANIHPTTYHGSCLDKPHLTVRFSSTRYSRETKQTVHINVHVWNPSTQQWRRYQSNNRPANYPYHEVYQDGNIRFNRDLPKTLALNEINTMKAEQAE